MAAHAQDVEPGRFDVVTIEHALAWRRRAMLGRRARFELRRRIASTRNKQIAWTRDERIRVCRQWTRLAGRKGGMATMGTMRRAGGRKRAETRQGAGPRTTDDEGEGEGVSVETPVLE